MRRQFKLFRGGGVDDPDVRFRAEALRLTRLIGERVLASFKTLVTADLEGPSQDRRRQAQGAGLRRADRCCDRPDEWLKSSSCIKHRHAI